uniref:Mid2 domain-containing protein n=1 Tax=Trichuris muris TaxID=70415 RepID=A0A5S6QAL8_TRIMR
MDIVFPGQLCTMWLHGYPVCLAVRPGSSSSNSSVGLLFFKLHLRMASVLLFIGYAQLAAALGWSFVLHKSSDPLYILTNTSSSENFTEGNITITTDRRIIMEHVRKAPLTQALAPFDKALSASTENASLIIDDVLNEVVHSSMTDMLSKLSDSLKMALQRLSSLPDFGSMAGDDGTKLNQLLETAGPLRLVKQDGDVSPSSSAGAMTKESFGQLVSLLHILENRASSPRTTAEPIVHDVAPSEQRRAPGNATAKPSTRNTGSLRNVTHSAKVIEIPVGVVLEQPPTRRRPIMIAPFLEPTVPPAIASSISSRPAEKSVVVEFLPSIKKPERFLRLHADVPEQPTTKVFSVPSVSLMTSTPRMRTPIKEIGFPREVGQSRRSATQILLETLFTAVGAVFGLLAVASVLLVFFAYRRTKRRTLEHSWRATTVTYPTFRSLRDPSHVSGESLTELPMSPDGDQENSAGSTDREIETIVAFAHSMPRSIGQTLRYDHTTSAEQWWKPYP